MGGAFMPLPPREVHPAARLHTRKCAELRRLQSPAYACPLPRIRGQGEALCFAIKSVGGKNDVNAPVALGWRADRGGVGCARGVRAGSRAGSADRRQSLVPRRAVPGGVGGSARCDRRRQGLCVRRPRPRLEAEGDGLRIRSSVQSMGQEAADAASLPPRRVRDLEQQDLCLRRLTYPDSGPPGWNAVNNAWEYDPATDEWKELAPMPTKRGAASAGVANGKIYVT